MNLKIELMIQMVRAWQGSLLKRVLGPNVSALIARSDNGLLFAVDPEDYGVGKTLRSKGSYGLDEIERLKPRITSGSRVLIVGAHIGTLAIPLSRLCREVVAIEANPATYGLLTVNIALNAASNCRALNIAASDREETLEFLLSRANSGGSKRVPKIKEYMYYYDKPETVSVKAVSLDAFLQDRHFDVVTMDIEGSEYFALKGMQEILGRCRVLVVEFLPHHLKNVSAVTVGQFLSVIQPHFSRLTVPTKRLTVDAPRFLETLTEMYDRGQGDSGIIFEKAEDRQ